MGYAKVFEVLTVWQESRIQANHIYSDFRTNKDFGFKDQIQRAAVSVMNNIAEGFERKSRPEFQRFLNIAKASCGEVRSMLYLASDLRYLEKEKADFLINFTTRLSKKIESFSKKLS